MGAIVAASVRRPADVAPTQGRPPARSGRQTGANSTDRAEAGAVIGCHDPQHLNNTFYFCERGAQGLAIDANPDKAQRFKNDRPRDIVVNAMFDAEPAESGTFHVLAPDTLSWRRSTSKGRTS